MNLKIERSIPAATPRVWEVGALCHAVADTLQARFNPVTVRGELSGFSRAASGHCYFNLKDASGQLRCAMFRRAADLMDFSPRDGELVEVRGKLGVYEQRGDLQLVVESMQRAGQGALFEQFLRLKAQLESEGLFAQSRKRPLRPLPRSIGVVTSLGAAALHDVVTALRRRVPHIPVMIIPALVQGAQAPQSLVQALLKMYHLTEAGKGLDTHLSTSVTRSAALPVIDAILLVRGGGSLEDLWAFNDEQLARTIVHSPVPLISGVGHETDFTIADFCADLRAPTPTAAAEMVTQPREVWLGALEMMQDRLGSAMQYWLDRQAQQLDNAAQRLGRPSEQLSRNNLQLSRKTQRLQHAMLLKLERFAQTQKMLQVNLPHILRRTLDLQWQKLAHMELRLQLLDPRLVLQRGYALLTDDKGQSITQVQQAVPGAALQAQLSDGVVDVVVTQPRLL